MILANGSYFRASGTRDAFGAWSDALEAEGLPPITVVDGDREPGEQEAGFRQRYRPAIGPSDYGPYGDRRYWPDHGYWVRISPGGTMAVPGSSNHEKRRAADLAEPYASPGPKYSRAVEVARRFGIDCEGASFPLANREYWHWLFRGALGEIGPMPSAGGSTPFPDPPTETKEWDEMASKEEIRAVVREEVRAIVTQNDGGLSPVGSAVWRHEMAGGSVLADGTSVPQESAGERLRQIRRSTSGTRKYIVAIHAYVRTLLGRVPDPVAAPEDADGA